MPDLPQKNSHCSYCGTRFSLKLAYPRRCVQCGNTTYSNPLPVSVVLVPVGNGLLLVRRTQEPQAGKWALPGGFIETRETWQEAGARELFEETGFQVDPYGINLFDTLSAPDGTLLVFGIARTGGKEPVLSEFVPSAETSAVMVGRWFQELAFSTHQEVADEYWHQLEEGHLP